MNTKFRAFVMAFTLLVLISATLLTLTLGITHPLPWFFLALLIIVIVLNKKFTESEFVTWKPEYSVGIESIDKDHKKLLHLINNLQSSTLYYTGEQFDREALDELISYTQYHFEREEELMEQNGYPDYVAHKAQHKQMTDDVLRMVKEYENESEKSIAELTEFLKVWLIKHINGSDQAYSEFLISKGVK